MISKTKRIIFVVLFILLNISLVKAETVACENLSIYASPNKFYRATDIKMYYTNEGTSHSYNYSLYTLNSESNDFVAYCRNAGKCATDTCETNLVSTHRFDCDKTVFDPTSEVSTTADKAVKAYEKGIVYMLQNGYKVNGKDNTTYQDYIAANIALRTYEMLWVNENTNGSSSEWRLNKAMRYYTNMWLKDATVKEKLNTITSKLGSGYIRTTEYYAATVTSWNNDDKVTDSIENKTLNLILGALDASIDYIENGSASLTWNSRPVKSTKPVVTKGDIEHYEVSHTYLFDIQKFDSKDSTIKADFDCINCGTYDVDYELYLNGNKVSSLTNRELLKLNTVKNGTGKVELEIVFKGNSNKYHGETINYEIDLKYFDDTISTEAYVMQDANCTGCQLFYMLYAENVTKTDKIEGSLELSTKTCKEVEDECLNQGITASCKIYEEKYNRNCAECTTYIQNAECSDEDSEINVTEGYDVDTSKCGNIDKNNENVVQCVINNEDPAGNSYKATTEGFENVKSNSYCSVYCKEDYHFVLPGIEATNSGKYFSLKASISGTKTCYMSKTLDYETFIDEKLEEQRKEIIERFNEWSKYNAIVNASFQYVKETGNTYRNGESYSSTCPVYSTIDGKRVKTGTRPCTKCRYISTSDCYTSQYKKYATYYTYSENGTRKLNTFDKTFGTATGRSSSCGKGSCTIKTYINDYNSYDYEGSLETATTELNAAIQKYRNMLNEYNSCSGQTVTKYNSNNLNKTENQLGWKMKYNYNPDITFWYEESYMNSVITNELETVGKINMTGITESFYSADNGKIPTTKTSEYITDNYFICYSSGSEFTCGTKEIKVGKAKYVKQEMNVDANYITPTQFYTVYPTGAIVVAEKGNEDNIENSSELTNLLPVGLGTKQGVYNYVIKAKNLGEYYNKSNKLGRIWGAQNSVVATVLEEAEEGNSCIEDGALTSGTIINGNMFNDGAYVCAYKVNCPDCPVECDPTCKNPDCPDNKCPVECDNCIYTNNSTNINYRPITPSDINPNDRDLGVNWKYDENSISTGLELKAYATTKEIEEAGETIYDINYEDTSREDFSMQVKLTASTISFIKNYNEKNESKGGYANNTLKCYDHKGNDGITYDNIYCYSTFLDELIEETGGPNSTGGSNNVKIVGGTRYFDESDRKSKTSISGYWTTWSEVSSKGWTIETQRMLAITQKQYKEIGIGPSWK